MVITDNDELANRLRRYSGLGYAGISGTKDGLQKMIFKVQSMKDM